MNSRRTRNHTATRSWTIIITCRQCPTVCAYLRTHAPTALCRRLATSSYIVAIDAMSTGRHAQLRHKHKRLTGEHVAAEGRTLAARATNTTAIALMICHIPDSGHAPDTLPPHAHTHIITAFQHVLRRRMCVPDRLMNVYCNTNHPNSYR